MTSLYIISSYATAWYTMQSAAELEKICGLVLYAQQRARTSGSEVEVIWNATEGRYCCCNYSEQLPKHLVFGALPECKGPPSAPEKPITNPITFAKERTVCYPDGTIQSGTLYMLDTKTKTQYALTVPIGHAHYLKRYRYSKNTWVVMP